VFGLYCAGVAYKENPPGIMDKSDEHLQRWRLVLGAAADPEGTSSLAGAEQRMDQVLEALYDSDRQGGLGSSSPNVHRWLGDIRRYFPTPMVQVMQRDALERLGLRRMLLEPELLEQMEPDVHLVATLLSLSKSLPATTRETARQVVRRVVEALEKRLRSPLQQALDGSLHKSSRKRRPSFQEINWPRTIQTNLRHYQPELKAIIPEKLVGHGRRGRQLRDLILLLDQSGSMAASMVYAAVLAGIMASLRSVHTRLIAFDTSVADLSEYLHDPVELLFSVQSGGGTDIQKALAYSRGLIRRPADTILVLISDLYEGGNAREMVRRFSEIRASGVQCVALLALSDKGAPAYDRQIAGQLAALGIPAFACTPDMFPELMAAAMRGADLGEWASFQSGR
jgi:Mg-chelatase subunit ChlD